jgi:hypothetical protein
MGKPEAEIEKYLDQKIKEIGGFTRKWKSPSHTGVQDRICFFPQGETWFIEIKTAGKLPTPNQYREIMRQRELEHNAGFLAGRSDVTEFMHQYGETGRQVFMYLQMKRVEEKME